MNLLSMQSLRFKLFIAILLTTAFALVIAGFFIVLYDGRDYEKRLFEDLRTQGELLGLASAPALRFEDPQSALESLKLIKARPQIKAAAIYDAKGALFSAYANPDAEPYRFPALPESAGQIKRDQSAIVFSRIAEHNEILGMIYLDAHYDPFARVWQFARIVCAVMILALVIAMLLSLWTQATIARPILALTTLARRIAQQKDYSLRAEKSTNDEIAWLVDAFNDLLAEMSRRSAALEASNRQLQEEIRERAIADGALLESEHRYRTLVTTLTAVVWVANSEGAFDTIQQPWSDYTGQSPPLHIGFGWRNAFHQDDRVAIEAAWENALAQSSPFLLEVRLWHALSGTYRYVRLRAVPLFGKRGDLREWIGMADDIDDRKRFEQEVLRLNAVLEQRVEARTAELERANKELEAFSYSVSHDLRTPLRAIDGFSQALLEDYGQQLDATGQDFLKRVRAGAQRMGHLIDDLLKLSRVSRAALTRESVDLSAISRDIVADLQAQESERDVLVVIAPNLQVAGDPALLRIALENLINNAWKYTGRRARAEIEVGGYLRDDEAYFFVRDNGAGFNMAYADKLFNAFQRLHDEAEFKGTGVGLATVQRIVARHGGRIWAESEVDRGSTFTIAFPIEEAHIHEYEADTAG